MYYFFTSQNSLCVWPQITAQIIRKFLDSIENTVGQTQKQLLLEKALTSVLLKSHWTYNLFHRSLCAPTHTPWPKLHLEQKPQVSSYIKNIYRRWWPSTMYHSQSIFKKVKSLFEKGKLSSAHINSKECMRELLWHYIAESRC